MFKIIQGLFYTIPFSCSGMLVYSRLRKPKNIGNLLFTFRMELIKKHLTLFSCSIIHQCINKHSDSLQSRSLFLIGRIDDKCTSFVWSLHSLKGTTGHIYSFSVHYPLQLVNHTHISYPYGYTYTINLEHFIFLRVGQRKGLYTCFYKQCNSECILCRRKDTFQIVTLYKSPSETGIHILQNQEKIFYSLFQGDRFIYT